MKHCDGPRENYSNNIRIFTCIQLNRQGIIVCTVHFMYSKYLNGNKTIRLLALRECGHFVSALGPSALWKKLPPIFEI